MTTLRAILVLLFTMLSAAYPAPAQQATDVAPRHQLTPDEQLWARIVADTDASATTQPFQDWFARERERITRLIENARSYLTLYPGGQRRDEAIAIELAALFELTQLDAQRPTQLHERVRQLLADPPSEAVEQEAAYWEIVCKLFARGESADNPSADLRALTVGSLPANVRGLLEEYVRRYPSSRHTPRLTARLFADAERRGDRERMGALATTLTKYFPQHMTAERLAARLRRFDTVGQPVRISLPIEEQNLFDTANERGKPIAIVVWAAFDAGSHATVQAIEKLRSETEDLVVVGVSLDPDIADTRRAAESLGIAWPQSHDRLGWGGHFVRSWDVQKLPEVFVIDRAGRLAGIGDAENWRDLVRKTLSSSPSP